MSTQSSPHMQYNFFEKYNIDPLAFDRTGLKWETLELIGEDYEELRPKLQTIADKTVAMLLHVPKIHSVNYRIKDREHLLEKIIRKSVSNQSLTISKTNYKSEIKDLLGIRVLHLYRENWTEIHDYLHSSCNFMEPPVAYIRQGDPNKLTRYYEEKQCTVREHPHGYRSVHYVIESSENGLVLPVEIQTRTLFEEAWGEIDHSIRYPYYSDNEILGRLSAILSRLSADADDLGTYMNFLQAQTIAREREHQLEIREKNRIIDSLRQQINALSIDSSEKRLLEQELGSLSPAQDTEDTIPEDFPWLEDLVDSRIFRNLQSQIEGFFSNGSTPSIPVSDDDLDILKNAQKGLVNLLKNPEMLKKLIKNDVIPSDRFFGKNGNKQ